jgi:hypothetical protein
MRSVRPVVLVTVTDPDAPLRAVVSMICGDTARPDCATDADGGRPRRSG